MLLSATSFTGCDLLSTEDDEEPACDGEVVIVRRLHTSTVSPPTISEPFRACYTILLVEQRDYFVVGELSESQIYIELAGPLLGSDGAHHYYHVIRLVARGKYFFESDPAEISASFTSLDANKLPVPGDKVVIDFEMLKIDPEMRQVGFVVRESVLHTSNNTKFVYDAYHIADLTVPENN